MSFNTYIIKKDGVFLNETLCFIGIVIQNNNNINVTDYIDIKGPYIYFTEGIICEPNIFNQLRHKTNAIVRHNGNVVIEKKTNATDPITVIEGMVLDLYDSTDNFRFNGIVQNLEDNRKFYCKNTEPMNIVNKADTVVGLASGYYLAELAYTSNSSNAIFYDYSQSSLEIQKQLIETSNRKQLLIDRLGHLTVGDRDATIEDLNEIDFQQIDIYYNYLQTANVTYHLLDVRTELDKLCELIPRNSILWVSNTLHYITSIPYFNLNNYDLIDNLVKEKNVTLLPHTRVYYES